jgi:hypothetical protein
MGDKLMVDLLDHFGGFFLSTALEAGLCDQKKKREKEKRHKGTGSRTSSTSDE